MNPLRWRLLFIGAITVWATYIVAPSIIYFATPKEIRNSEEEMAKRIPSWLPQKHVSLGLDLQGGVQLVLGVNTASAVDNKLSRLGTETQRWSDDNKEGVAKAYNVGGKQVLRVELKDGVDTATFKDKFRKEFPGMVQANRTGQTLDFSFEDEQMRRIKASAIEQAEKVVRSRVDKWGVSEPLINRRQADNSILVQLPGFKDPTKAKELLGRTAQLKFKLVDDQFRGFENLTDLPAGVTLGNNGGQSALISEDRQALQNYAKLKVPEDRQLFFHREDIAGGKKSRYTTYVVEASTEIGGDDVLDSFVTEDNQGLDHRPQVSMKFTGPGGKRFGDVTGANVGHRLAIVLDDEVVSAPNIQSKIATGQGVITMGNRGSWQDTYNEANQLALILKSGALPATIEVLEERQVGASLGPELADEGIKGVLLGLFLVFAYMVYHYRRPGMLACAALLLNGLYLLGLMAMFGFSLSLPGIAGFVLTLGMAVDANVLINERIRQELGEGKSSKKAIENGFGRVFWTIFDAHVTALIAGFVLLETNPSGPIRGFAVTLIIGLLVSLFTSLNCTKAFFELVMARSKSDKEVRQWLGERAIEKQRHAFNINFAKYSVPFTAFCGVLILGTLGLTIARGLNWGVDFAGGTELQARFAADVQPTELNAIAKKVGLRQVTLQALGGGNRQYLMRFGMEDIEATGGKEVTQQDEQAKGQELKTALLSDLATKKPEILSIDYVGPQVGKELRSQGVASMLASIFFILLYVAFRFNMRFGPGVLIKMFIDVFFVLAFYQLFWRSFDLTSVAAFLTIIGYSVNDTIVIFDRIRENLGSHARRPLLENINISLNETLTRSLNTSGVTLVSLFGIMIFGSGQIWNFAAAMALGIVAATLTSTFVASFSLVWFDNWYAKRTAKKSTQNSQVQGSPARS
jgi:protein-export membrane protein SecD/preprotein translocase SecF subunit